MSPANLRWWTWGDPAADGVEPPPPPTAPRAPTGSLRPRTGQRVRADVLATLRPHPKPASEPPPGPQPTA